MDSEPPTEFPAIVLRPLADCRHAWAAVLLDAPFERHSLCRLFGELGLYEALGRLPCVLRLDDPARCPDDAPDLLPAEQIRLCLPAAQCADPARAGDLERLRGLGFSLMTEGLPPPDAALPAGLDAFALPVPAPLFALPAGRPGPHLALGVDRPADFRHCRDLGFHWFAGNYPLHGSAEPTAAATTHQALLLRLLTLVAADADARELEDLFKRDAHLSYQLLRLVNSVAFSLTTKITSFSQAITLLGRRQLQRWLQLLVYAHAPGVNINPLLPRAAFRAELMESLRTEAGADQPRRDEAFMAGMFSLLELLLQMPRERIFASLNLGDEITAALLRREGELGRLLALVEAAETESAPALTPMLAEVGVGHEAWAHAQSRALAWTVQILSST